MQVFPGLLLIESFIIILTFIQTIYFFNSHGKICNFTDDTTSYIYDKNVEFFLENSEEDFCITWRWLKLIICKQLYENDIKP